MNIIPDQTVWFCRDTELSKTDQRDFNSVDEQFNYFMSRVVATVERCYYIRASGSDWSGSVKVGLPYQTLYNCDYLFYRNTGFLSKYFYAYIDSVEYVDTNTTKVNFTVDHYQTWLLDYELKQSLVVREHIEQDVIQDNLDIFTTQEPFIQSGHKVLASSPIINMDGVEYIFIYTFREDGAAINPANTINGLQNYVRIYYQLNKPENLNAILAELQMLDKAWKIYAAYYFIDVQGQFTQWVLDHPASTFFGAGISYDDVNIPFYRDIELDLNQYLKLPLDTLELKNLKQYCQSQAQVHITQDMGMSINDINYALQDNGKITIRLGTTIVPQPQIWLQVVGNYNGIADNQTNVQGLVCMQENFPQLQLPSNNINLTEISKSISKLALRAAQTGAGMIKNYTPNPIANLVKDLESGRVDIDSFGDPQNINLTMSEYVNMRNTQYQDALKQKVIDAPKFDKAQKYAKRLETMIQGSPQVNTQAQQSGSMQVLQSICSGLHNIYFTISVQNNIVEVDKLYSRLGYSTLRYEIPNTKQRPHWNYIQTSDSVVVGPIPEEAKHYIESMYDAGVTFWHDDDMYNYDRDNF